MNEQRNNKQYSRVGRTITYNSHEKKYQEIKEAFNESKKRDINS